MCVEMTCRLVLFLHVQKVPCRKGINHRHLDVQVHNAELAEALLNGSSCCSYCSLLCGMRGSFIFTVIVMSLYLTVQLLVSFLKVVLLSCIENISSV